MFDVLFEDVTWLLNPFLLAEIVEVCFIHTKAYILSLSRVPNLHSMDICVNHYFVVLDNMVAPL